MSHFDDFFKANYRRMVGYCTSIGYREADVEEEVADVIMRHYDDYKAKIEGPNPDTTMRSWMNRRVLLNLRSRYNSFSWPNFATLDDDHDVLTFDDPADVLDATRRAATVHPILVTYEPYGGTASAKGENTSADKTRFCRERKKFLQGLAT